MSSARSIGWCRPDLKGTTMREVNRRLTALEQRRPPKHQRVAIISEHDPEPADADFVIRICATEFPEQAHA